MRVENPFVEMREEKRNKVILTQLNSDVKKKGPFKWVNPVWASPIQKPNPIFFLL